MKLNDVKKLHQKKYRDQLGYYLVEGEHLILELQKAMLQKAEHHAPVASSPNTPGVTLYITDEHAQWASQLAFDFTLVTITEKQMAQMSDTKSPQGMLACVPLTQSVTGLAEADTEVERCIYLHEIQDPGNLGTILRTLAWFGNFRLLLSANSVDPFNPKVVRASMGAIFHVPIELDVSLNDLQKRFDKFAYLDMKGTSINSADFADHECYLFGNEARGVPHEALLGFNASPFTIKGSGSIDSLNLASAVNICVYELSA